MMHNINWIYKPFPYIVIDNYLSDKEFNDLNKELDNTKNELQFSFRTALEVKSIYKDTAMKENVNNLVMRMSSDYIKQIFHQIIGGLDIVSMREVKDYSGLSPYHVTQNNGYLGSHIDHSSIEAGSYKHIANSIFYASKSWEKHWGGETILFSKNGFFQKVKIDPIPNRLILFIHTANSFHGVDRYYSNKRIERRTFYHDYYVEQKDLNIFLNNLKTKTKFKFLHIEHDTTFVPFFPFGLNRFKLKYFFRISNFKYLKNYINYFLRLLKTSLKSKA